MSAAGTDCVKVAVRVRPFVQREIERGCVSILEKTPGEQQLEVTGDSNSKSQDLYTFNNVFMPEDTQEKVYVDCVQPIIGKLFEGYNVTILAYGQTGSGKTYSMGTVFDGDLENSKMGIIPRALRDIFGSINNDKGDSVITVTCSFLELYQEVLYDLLADRPRNENICDIREDGVKGIYISGLSEVPVGDELEATKCLMKGGNCRSIGATAMNDVSSRSHAIFTVNVTKTQLNGDGKTSAKFHLVDLAGSERSKKTQATGTRFKEGVKINQGLLALGNVISALGGGSSGGGYISYRDSKLTRLLQDSLGGNSVTLMVACVSPADYNIEETLSTLRYADRAKKIKNKPVKNEDSHASEVARLKKTIQELRMQLMGDPTKAFGVKIAAECANKCKAEIAQKNKELNDARIQLNSLFNTLSSINDQHILEDHFINEFITAYESFRDKILKTCSAEFAMPDTNIFTEIREKAEEIQTIIKKFKQQSAKENDERDRSGGAGSLGEIDSEKYSEFTQNQITIFAQINALERDMKIKQTLLERKFQNVPVLDEDSDKTMIEYENTIKNLEKELEELRSSNANSVARRDHNATKVNMDRKHKIEKLEKDLTEVRKKCTSLEKTKKLADQDRKRIDDLRHEIEDMKKARVQLIRQQRSESEMYKRFISNRDKEINCLKEKGRKAENEMKRRERLHEKQQAVLKRKVEEAKATNKRLQDAVDKSRKIQKERLEKTIEKRTDVVTTYIEHEILILISSIDVKNTMQSLMNDRGLLLERLQNLKSTVSKTPELEEEIKQLEEDLEMRNAQITDMRGRLAESDVDAKLKNIPDNFSTVPELRIAMSYVLRALVEGRDDFINNKTKSEDLKTAYEASEERLEVMMEEKEEMKNHYENEISRMEREYEQKLFLLCQKRKGDVDKETDDLIFNSVTEQLTDKIEENSVLKTRLQELEKKLEALEKGEEKKDQFLKPPTHKKQKVNNTYVKNVSGDEEDFEEDEDDFSFDDSFSIDVDPDWKKTPQYRGKRASRTTTLLKESLVNRMDNSGILINISEASEGSSVVGVKRTSGGQAKCNCKGSCATKLCGCKKNNNYCTSTCRCSHACLNQPNISKESTDDGDDKSRAEKENEKTPEKSDRDNLKSITTPYYPYDTKKRRPLLNAL